MTRAVFALLAAGLAMLATVERAAAAAEMSIGYLELTDDPRYDATHQAARYLSQPLGRPYAGAETALDEVKFHGAAAGVTFALLRESGRTSADLVTSLETLYQSGVRFFLLDLPADQVSELAQSTKGRDILLFNLSARADRLRQEACQQHLLNVIPSHAMLMDALAQYLRARKWTDVLALAGPSNGDEALLHAFQRSAKRFGLDIVATRRFVLSNDPRQRDQGSVRLLTTGDYDVVFVADTDGEFARGVPYQTIRPRLVVGSEGMAPTAWHWAWERNGGPQLEKRFEKHAKRQMRGEDWAAWMAVKAVAEAVQRTRSADFALLKDYLLSQDMVLDGFKGYRSNFRPWDNQLRQPILLATHNWVVDRAPLAGFLHRVNNLDTLGIDESESRCRF